MNLNVKIHNILYFGNRGVTARDLHLYIGKAELEKVLKRATDDERAGTSFL